MTKKVSNTSKGWGSKGSKFWMQAVVYYPKLQKELNEKIGDVNLQWLSPLAGKNETFDEYKLNQKNVPERLSFDRYEDFYDFWPKRQPQWDGIAISGDGKTLYLVEAKAHLKELNSKLSSSNEDSTNKIKATLGYVRDKYFPNGRKESWEKGYYQLGNRLTFLKIMNERVPFGGFDDVKLVLLNFVNDFTYKCTDLKQWEEHYRNVWMRMIEKKYPPNDVLMIFYDVSNKGVYPQ